MPPSDPIPTLTRAIGQVKWRLRLDAALGASVRVAAPSATLTALGLLALHLGALGEDLPMERALAWALAAASLAPLLAALFAASRRRTSLDAAERLDRAAGTTSRMANAWVFSATPRAQRSRFEQAAIRDACPHLERLDPRQTGPLTRPPGLAVVALALLGLVAAASLRRPAAPPPARAAEATAPPLLLASEDLDDFEAELRARRLEDDDPPALREATRELERLLAELRDRRLEERAALERVDALTQRFLEGRPADTALPRERLARLGQNLSEAASLRDAAEALREGDAERAAAEVQRQAERLARGELNRAEVERVRRALERAAMDAGRREDQAVTRARERQERLLRREQQRASTPARRRLLQRHRRELERLRREEARAQEQRRQLERLERDLRDAAARSGAAASRADAMSRAAQDLHRIGQQQRQDARSRAMARQLEQLRELLRRSRPSAQNGQERERQGSQGAGERRRHFTLRAGGQPIGVGRRPGRPAEEGQSGMGGMGGAGAMTGMGGAAGGESGMGGMGGMGGIALQPGGQGGDAILELPAAGSSQGRAAGAGTGSEPGPGVGEGHDETRLDDPSTLAHRLSNSRVEGQAAEGPSRSEVIDGAAARGFVGQGYERVYGDYRGHSEEVLERDQIPPGYRFYVRRYFQLIRPREEQP